MQSQTARFSNCVIVSFSLALRILIVVIATVPIASALDSRIDLELVAGDGSRVSVPGSGIWYDRTEYELTQEIMEIEQKLNEKISNIYGESSGASAFRTALSPDALGITGELIDTIELGRRTSGKDRTKLSEIKSLLDWISEMIDKSRSGSDSPITHISVNPSIEGISIEYIHLRDYIGLTDDQRNQAWVLYAFGKRLPLGLYYFRIAAPSIVPRTARISVWDDPTEAVIQVRTK